MKAAALWALVVGIATAVAIGSDPQYIERGLAVQLGNAIAAGLLFGAATHFVVDALVRAGRRFSRATTAKMPSVLSNADLPSGPSKSLSALHPIVAGASTPLWNDQHYRDAVLQAARAVNSQAQSKLRRYDKADARLLVEAFSENPPQPGSPRLRFPGEPMSETWRDRLRGARTLAEGAFAGIRNIAAHDQVEWNRDTAMDYLSVFSVIARWVDEAEIHRTE
jgi:uncharacterized protein (TIGR02391 family)